MNTSDIVTSPSSNNDIGYDIVLTYNYNGSVTTNQVTMNQVSGTQNICVNCSDTTFFITAADYTMFANNLFYNSDVSVLPSNGTNPFCNTPYATLRG